MSRLPLPVRRVLQSDPDDVTLEKALLLLRHFGTAAAGAPSVTGRKPTKVHGKAFWYACVAALACDNECSLKADGVYAMPKQCAQC